MTVCSSQVDYAAEELVQAMAEIVAAEDAVIAEGAQTSAATVSYTVTCSRSARITELFVLERWTRAVAAPAAAMAVFLAWAMTTWCAQQQ